MRGEPCKNEKCFSLNGYIGTWRKDKNPNGKIRGWCKKCLKNEEDKINFLKKDDQGRHNYDCRGINGNDCPKKKTDIRVLNREEAKLRERLKLCSSCFKVYSQKFDSESVFKKAH